MNSEKRKYDLVCSLGGNCAAAFQLKFRDMRLFSLPFDWVYIENEKPIGYLCEGFADGFKNLALKRNLKCIEGNEAHSVIFQDEYSGYFFPNHFKKNMESEYDDFAKKLCRRTNRLLAKIKSSQKVLFILSTAFPFNVDNLMELNSTLLKLYPQVCFDFEVVSFRCLKDEEITVGNIHQRRCTRQQNLYDFYKTNFEWQFCDDIVLSRKAYREICLLSLKAFGKRFRINFEIRRKNDE